MRTALMLALALLPAACKDKGKESEPGDKPTSGKREKKPTGTPRPQSKLTVTLGVRWEKLDNPDDPILNPFDQNPNGSFRQTGEIPDEDKAWSPRFGISWSPDNKSVIRLSAGRFWSRTPLLLWVQPFTSNGIQATQYTVNAQTSGGAVTGAPTDPLSPAWGSA